MWTTAIGSCAGSMLAGAEWSISGIESLEAFAGNMLELRASDGTSVLAMSAQARGALAAVQFDALASCVDRVVVTPLARIEAAGGGSMRCMLAEVFLPRRRPQS